MVKAMLERSDNHLKRIFLNPHRGHIAFILLIHNFKHQDCLIKIGRFGVRWLIIALNLDLSHSIEIPTYS